MLESDADRLAMIKSLGGLSVSVRGQSFWAIFDNGNVDVLGMVESSDPFLTCRTSDVLSLAIVKDDAIEIAGEQYRMKTTKDDGTGMTHMALKR